MVRSSIFSRLYDYWRTAKVDRVNDYGRSEFPLQIIFVLIVGITMGCRLKAGISNNRWRDEKKEGGNWYPSVKMRFQFIRISAFSHKITIATSTVKNEKCHLASRGRAIRSVDAVEAFLPNVENSHFVVSEKNF